MPTRLVFGSLVVLAGCGTPHDAPLVDGGSVLTDGGDIDAPGDLDGSIADAPPDAAVPDETPPQLVAVSPATGSSVWLHAPIRITFDEPLDGASIAETVTAHVAGTVVPAQLAFEPPSTLLVTLAGSVRGIGSIELDLTGSVADLAGNAHTAPIELAFVAAAWSAVPVDRGVARSAPELAVAPDGTVYAAWLVGAPGARRVAVGALVANTWQALGSVLGAADVGSAAIALDPGGAPLVAWSESGQAHVARWAGAWSELNSPGAASAIALVTPPGGAPLVGLFGASAGVRELAGSTWQPIGSDITPPSAIAGTPVLAAAAPGAPVIGWVDAQAQLRVYRHDASWTAIAPLPVSAGSRPSLAARGGTLAIAWDQRAGSSGVLAARLTGTATAWTRLGRALDIDILGDAVAPAVAIDATGAPLVGWTELVETHQRGAIARWTGSAWSIVGGVSWLADAQAAPGRTRIALHDGDAAVVATSAGGVVRIARFNGPRVAAVGLAARVSIAGCAFDANNPPALLSQTGCFDLTTPAQPVPHPGLIPFDVVSELWSDGAKKRRYLALADTATLTPVANGGWTAPPGSFVIKQFDLETTAGDPASRRPIETRFWVHDATLGWTGFSYRWNQAGTNASLLTDGEFRVPWPMDDGSTHTHDYPSRAHCRSCHHASMGPLLGVRPEQLARWFDYDGVIADQLATLYALGVVPSPSATPFVSIHDPGETVERRMRGYMAGNCAHCHNPQNLSIKDLRYTTPLAQTKLCAAVTPGNPGGSQVYQLVSSRPGMPCLGTLAIDPTAVQVLGAWIAGMTSCP